MPRPRQTKYWRVILVPEWGMWETCRDGGIIAIGYPEAPEDSNVRKFRDEMQIGDKVVAYLKRGQIGAIGIIVGDYSVDEVILHGHHWRIRKVQWNHKSFNGWEFTLSDGTKATLGQRPTVMELSESEYKEIEKQILSL